MRDGVRQRANEEYDVWILMNPLFSLLQIAFSFYFSQGLSECARRSCSSIFQSSAKRSRTRMAEPALPALVPCTPHGRGPAGLPPPAPAPEEGGFISPGACSGLGVGLHPVMAGALDLATFPWSVHCDLDQSTQCFLSVLRFWYVRDPVANN